jgi:hypothetical protein
MVFQAVEAAVIFMAKQVLGQIIDTITQKILSTFEEQIKKVINTCVTTVVSGAWRGDGADRFSNEMTNIIEPWVEKIITMLVGMKAAAILGMADIEEADKATSAMASSLSDDFKKIYA